MHTPRDARSFQDTNARIARSSAEAVTGYANAAVAAYADFASQALGLWAQTIDAMLPKPEPRSWYRHPDQRQAPTLSAQPFAWMGLPAQPAQAWSQIYGQFWQHALGKPAVPSAVGYAVDFNPFTLWMRAWPLQGNPAAWPMAFALMGAGWSRNVAYPMAQANVAAIDAASTAARAAQQQFATYRSDGGHATAQIMFQTEKAVAALMLPIGADMMAPWLAAFNAFPRTI